ncbi:ggdef domain protein [Nautilia profundicola AmH]|uniref:diguanylate cyclase n=1 Tax=Nautilia profundicola (strain ATCC BAA-1463 / DSM 18972 / AmH) TaxID=598659 RepID=B9L6D0_NAUPA|nr:diguanylate cyclase [Nautilia profundicola]ACM92665.1 ggdef domain protein [Nautilia profundicola AmH]
MFIDDFKKESIKIPLYIYLAVMVIYKFSEHKGIVIINPFVEKFATFDIVALFFLYVLYAKKKLSYELFLYFFAFSIFMVLNFVIYYNTHVVYRCMWIIAVIPFMYLYAGKKIGTFFSIYFLIFVIIAYLNDLLYPVTLQDLYVFVFSDILVASISYFFILNLEKHTFIFIKKHQDLENQAYTDSLTNVYNRRGFFKAIRNKKGVLGIFDLDDFKKINDMYGHKVGDEYLKAFTKILKQNTRKNDIIGRIGGDEFVVLFVGSTSTDIKNWAIKFYDTIERNSYNGLKLRVSSGFSEFHGNIKESFMLADEKLYKSKEIKNTFTF